MNLTIELFLTGMTDDYKFVGKSNEIIEKMSEEVPGVQLVRKGGEERDIDALSVGEFTEEFALMYYQKMISVTIRVSILSEIHYAT